MNKSYVYNVLQAIGVAFLLALSYIGSRIFSSLFQPYAFTAARIGLATLFFIPFVSYKEFSKVNRSYLIAFTGIGFFGFFLTNLFFTFAVNNAHTPAMNLAVIQATQPILVLVAYSLLMRKKPSISVVLAFVCAFIGLAIVVTHGNFGSLQYLTAGELYMMIGNIVGVVNNLLMQLLSAYFSALFITFFGSCLGMLFLLPLGLNNGLSASFSQLTALAWFQLLFVATACTALAFWGVTKSIASLGASIATFIIIGTLPLFVAILSYFFLGEPISLIQIAGGALVIISLYFGIAKTPA